MNTLSDPMAGAVRVEDYSSAGEAQAAWLMEFRHPILKGCFVDQKEVIHAIRHGRRVLEFGAVYRNANVAPAISLSAGCKKLGLAYRHSTIYELFSMRWGVPLAAVAMAPTHANILLAVRRIHALEEGYSHIAFNSTLDNLYVSLCWLGGVKRWSVLEVAGWLAKTSKLV